MSGYAGNGQAGFLDSNRQIYLWSNEVIAASATVGSLSVAYQLRRIDNAFYPWGLSFEAWFASDPGVFEIDIVGANNDLGSPNPGHYVTLGTITSVNGSFVGRWDMPSNIWPKYVAAYMKTLTNAVAVTLQMTK